MTDPPDPSDRPIQDGPACPDCPTPDDPGDPTPPVDQDPDVLGDPVLDATGWLANDDETVALYQADPYAETVVAPDETVDEAVVNAGRAGLWPVRQPGWDRPVDVYPAYEPRPDGHGPGVGITSYV